jgi:predicted SAM-dependent methyltransferase
MNYIRRDKDVITREEDLRELYTFKNFPVFMGCTDQPKEKDVVADMSWQISISSGMIQLNPLLPLEVVYAEEHGSGTVGDIWNQHHEAFAEFVTKFSSVESVLEIGGLHGHLAKKSLAKKDLDWTIVEPNPRVPADLPVKVIKGFFDDRFTSEEKYDAVIHSHVLEHVYDPLTFMQHISDFMKKDSLLIMSVPNLEAMLRNNYTNCLNFEHTYFASQPYVELLLNHFGYELLEESYFKEDHSIFFCAKKVRESKEEIHITSGQRDQLYMRNLALFSNYIKYHEELVSDLNKIEGDVYLFGAHIFSQTLLQFGLDAKKIINILDNDPNKQNKRLYGTDLIVKSPEALRGIESGTVIVKTGVYNEEIKKQIESINPNIKVIC